MPLFSHQQLRTLLKQHLVSVNTAPDIAQKVADNLVEASLKGHDSHGVTLLPFGGHKGAGLSLICSLLGAALTGGETESHNIPPRAGIINNMLSILFDPERLGAEENYKQELLAQVDWARRAGWSRRADPQRAGASSLCPPTGRGDLDR